MRGIDFDFATRSVARLSQIRTNGYHCLSRNACDIEDAEPVEGQGQDLTLRIGQLSKYTNYPVGLTGGIAMIANHSPAFCIGHRSQAFRAFACWLLDLTLNRIVHPPPRFLSPGSGVLEPIP